MSSLNLASIIEAVAVWLVPGVFAITVHEVAHGWVAKFLGDPHGCRCRPPDLNPLRTSTLSELWSYLFPCIS
jgi:hypothetical protein